MWIIGSVREWSDVAREAKKNLTKAHVARIFEICDENGFELRELDGNNSKFEGRAVCEGNYVKDENGDHA